MKKELRRANGTGTVYELSGRRRRPYVASVTAKCTFNSETGKYEQKRQTIGYYSTRDEVIHALYEYNEDPYDLSVNNVTFDEVYQKWSKNKYSEISPSAVRTWKSAYSHLCPLYKMSFREIRAKDIDKCIQNALLSNPILRS